MEKDNNIWANKKYAIFYIQTALFRNLQTVAVYTAIVQIWCILIK